MELLVETHVQSQDRQKEAQQFVDNRAQAVKPENKVCKKKRGGGVYNN